MEMAEATLEAKTDAKKKNAYCLDQSNDSSIEYPLKYYVEVINDSRKCVAVRVSEFIPKSVTLQKFIFGTLQVNLNGWYPRPTPADEVALLPHQRCRAWIGIDTKKFTNQAVDNLEGSIGALTLTANGKKISFDL